MKTNLLLILAAALALAPATVRADNHAGEMTEDTSLDEKIAAEVAKQVEAALAEQAPMDDDVDEAEAEPSSHEISGWLDQSITYDQGAGNPVYGLFEAAVRMSHAINENYGGYLQLNGRWSQALSLTSGENGALQLIAREAYAYAQNDDGGVQFKFGKWYAPIGFELADPPDLYQYSNANVFGHFLPTEMIGVIGGFGLGDFGDLSVYVGGAPSDDDWAMANRIGTPSIGERLGINIGDAGGIGLSVLVTNPGGSSEGDMELVVDLDGAFEFDALTLGFEAVMKYYEAASGQDLGALVMANYAINDWLSLTGRYDIVVLDAGGNVMSITGSPLINFAPGWDVVVEGRYDIASNDAATAGVGTAAPDDGNFTGALELIYQF